ncbi:MAG: putative metal-binding motif-containing protein, partial [Myxococcota bacterium]
RAGGPALFGARFDEAGLLVASDAGGVELVDGSARRTRPDVIFDGTDYRMVWTDGRADEATIQLATVDPETLAVSDQDIAIDDPSAAQVESRIAALGNDQVLVVGTSSNDIARARRRAASRWLDGMAISLGRGSVSDAMGAMDGSHYLVAVGTHVGHTQLRFWRIDASGEVGDAFEHIHRDSWVNSRVSLIPFRGEFVVAFERWVRASEAVSVAFVDPAGSLHDEVVASKEWVDPSSLEAVQGNANHPAAAGIGDRYLAVWDYDRFDQGIYATRMRGEILEEVEPLAGVRPDRLWHDEVPIQVSSTGVEPDIACGDAQCLVAWRVDGDDDSHIRATFMNPFSAQVFSPNGVVIAGSEGAVGRPRVASNGDDFVAVWSDGGERIRSVEASTTSDLASVQADTHSDVPGEERDPAVASDGSGFVVVWSREEDGTPTVVAQRTSSGGALHVVSSDPDGVGVPAIGHNGADAYLAAWQYRDPTRARTRIALLGVDGERAGPLEGIDLERSCGSPSVGSRRGSTSWIVACLDTQTDSAAHAIEMARIETDLSISHRRRWKTAEPHETHEVSVTGTRFGVLMLYTETQRRDGRDRRIIVANNYDDEPGQPLSVGSISDLFSVPSDQRNPAIATSDTQHLIVWEDTRGPGRTLWGTRLGFDGLVADPTGIVIGERSSTFNERSPAIASNGSDFLVAFTRDEAQPHIYAKRIDSTGRPSGEESRLWNGDRPAVASDGQDYLVVHESGGSIGAHRISAEGAPIGSGFTIIGEGGAIPGEGTSAAGRPTLVFSAGHYVLAYEAWYSTAGIGIVWLDPSGAKLDGFPRRLPGAGVDHDCPAVTGSAEGAALAWRDLGSGEVRLSLFDPSGGVRAGVESRVLGAAAGTPALAASEHALLVLWPDAESAGVFRRSAYDRVSDTFLHEGEVVLDADASRGGLHLAAAPADAFTAVYHRFSARELVDNEGQTPQGVSASALQIFARTLHVFDRDGDGLPPALDCDDGDAAIGAQTLVYVDRDGDGFGDADGSGTLGCLGELQSDGSVAVTNNDDCDDDQASVNPDAFETHANDIDENCDTRYACLDDIDGDGRVGLFDHDAPCGDTYPEVEIEDCDESNDAVYAGAQEIVGSGVDEDCDGQELCYADADGDGFGTAATVISIDSDCDDFGESELDQDCDDTPGSGTAIQGPSQWYPDADGDGYGDAGSAPLGTSCTILAGGVDNNRDCDDSDAQRRPGAREICGDALDQDCDGFTDRPVCHIDACEGELGTEPELYQAGVREADPAYAPDPPPGLAIEGLYLAESEVQLAPLKNVHFSIDAESGEALLAGLFRVEALNAPGGGGWRRECGRCLVAQRDHGACDGLWWDSMRAGGTREFRCQRGCSSMALLHADHGDPLQR